MRVALALAMAVCAGAWAASPAAIMRFSAAPSGEPPPPWTFTAIKGRPPVAVAMVDDEAARVARVTATAAAGSLVHALDADVAATPLLRWRWKVDRVVERGDLARRDGDDFAARVYVTFAVPDAALTLWERARMRIARALYGERLPAAALCYVWDNRHPVGTTAWNAYTSQVRMVVVESGAARAGSWVAVARDVEADYRAAFGTRYPGAVPRISGVAISADTDQTGESVVAWFGDLVLEARP